MNNTTWQKCTIFVIFLICLTLVASFAGAVQAASVQDTLTSEQRKAVMCYAYAKGHRMPQSVIKVHVKRLGTGAGTAEAVYWLGHTIGTLDAYGNANAGRLGGYAVARHDAAKHFYKLMGCTTSESM